MAKMTIREINARDEFLLFADEEMKKEIKRIFADKEMRKRFLFLANETVAVVKRIAKQRDKLKSNPGLLALFDEELGPEILGMIQKPTTH